MSALRKPEDRAGLRFDEWQPLDAAASAIRERTLASGSDFLQRNWDCKYLDARIDMRTGAVRLVPGNLP